MKIFDFLLLLSEVGVIGTITYLMIPFIAFVSISKIKDKNIKYTGIIIAIILIFNSVFGSQLINEVEFASIAYIYLALFVGYSKVKEDGKN